MRVLLLVVLVALSTVLHAQLEVGLRGHWTFGAGSTMDLSGQNNNGSIVGGVSTTNDRSGNPGCALLFPGNNSHVTVPFSADLDIAPADAFTVSLWYQGGSTAVGDLEWLFGKRAAGGSFEATDYALSLYDLNRVLGSSGNSTALWSPVMPPIPDAQWHHVALIYTNGNWQLWLDDVLVVAPIQQTFVSQSNHGIAMGVQFAGALDDIRFYDRAVSPQEVDLLFQEAANCASTTGLPESVTPAMSAAPNPATDVLTVQLSQPNGTLELFDATGRSVLRRGVTSTTATLHLGHLTEGVYLLRYGSGASAVVKRIAKR
ncbi:MAG: T9SS type A sorting domain-containing protein [Flavobacteriales bacterium]|nr:T9SS type A sorting domain-containing protein [Flavobacteriales bacterium]